MICRLFNNERYLTTGKRLFKDPAHILHLSLHFAHVIEPYIGTRFAARAVVKPWYSNGKAVSSPCAKLALT
jgi:hypothetical protein